MVILALVETSARQVPNSLPKNFYRGWSVVKFQNNFGKKTREIGTLQVDVTESDLRRPSFK
jgi:hypothetical protein